MIYQKVRYTLNSSIGKLKIGFDRTGNAPDPINWDQVDTTIGRSERTDGIFTEIKQNLDFTKDARKYLLRLEAKEGSEADVTLVREIYNGYDWVVKNEGALDLGTLSWNSYKATCDYVDNTFSETFKSNFNEAFELSRNETINGDFIAPVNVKNLYIQGKDLFLQSRLENNGDQETDLDYDVNGDIRIWSALPLRSAYRSDQLVSGFVSGFGFDQNEGGASNYIIQSDVEARERRIIIDVSFTINSFFADDLDSEDLYLTLSKYDQVNNQWIVVNEFLHLPNPNAAVGSSYSFQYDENVVLGIGENLFLGWRFNNNRGDNLGDADYELGVTYTDTRVDIEENKYFRPTYSDSVTMFDAFSQVVKIIDKDAVFESNLLTEKWSDLLIASGETVRNIKYNGDSPTVVTASFEELYNAMFTIEPVGFDVMLDKGVKKVVLEPIQYFFNRENKIDLGVSKDVIEWSVDDKYLYGHVDIGYSESGDNEDVYGLQVTHVLNKFTTPLTKSEGVYSAINKCVADSSEIEVQRRKQYDEVPDEDGQYDKNILLFDAIETEVIGNYRLRDNDLDFESVTGIYSVDRSYNMRLSPINCLLRHGNWLKPAFSQKYFHTQKVRYASTSGNVALTTQVIGGNSITEDTDLLVSDLDTAFITSRKATFEIPYTKEVEAAITNVENNVRGAYSILKIEESTGKLHFGYLLKADIKETIKIEMIQANGI